MTWDPPRPRWRRTQLLTMGATWSGHLDAWMRCTSTFRRLYPHIHTMTLAEPRESTSRHAQYLTGPMTVSEGGQGPG